MVKQKASKETKRKKRFYWLRRDWRLYAMLAVPVIWYLIFCYKPMTGLIIAFQKYNICSAPHMRKGNIGVSIPWLTSDSNLDNPIDWVVKRVFPGFQRTASLCGISLSMPGSLDVFTVLIVHLRREAL